WTVQFDGAECHDISDGWQFMAGTTGASVDSIVLQFIESGVYTIALTVENDCSISTVSTTINVAAPPVIVLEAIEDYCAVFTIDPSPVEVFSCNGTNSLPVWDFGPNALPATFTGLDPGPVTFTASGPKTITVTVTNECGATTETINFEIFDLPTVDAVASDAMLCVGDGLFLQAIAGPGLSFQWSGPAGFNSTQQNPTIPSVTLVNTGWYEVTVTDANLCTATDSIFIEVNPLPVVSAGPDMVVCLEALPITLVGSPAGGQWQGTGVNSAGVFMPTADDTYELTYTYTDANGCTNSDMVVIVVPPGVLQETYSDSLCIDEFEFINGTLYNVDNPSGTEVFVNSATGCDSLILQVALGFWELEMTTTTID
ncbi:MAG: hypothetical protein KDC44_24810, partial [Phaeodactylibacter sp.]|nr:hypothetical protein [Phaeodactylibacter sp.]